ncbi:MAG: response regulator [Sphingobacteriales bacterium]|nr:MAG: response regulator [Sphingobacteriales bacterium]
MQKILLQETDPSILDVLTIALQTENFDVHGRLFYDDLLAAIQEFRPQVVLLDYRLNGTDSAEACRLIKTAFPWLPVLALSCNARINFEYKEKGFDDYIKKPFDLCVLFKIVRKYIKEEIGFQQYFEGADS